MNRSLGLPFVSFWCFVVISLGITTVSSAQELRFLSSFETANSLGFSPDGVTYQAGNLFISSAGQSPSGGCDASCQAKIAQGVFEVTQSGALVATIDIASISGLLGFSIIINQVFINECFHHFRKPLMLYEIFF